MTIRWFTDADRQDMRDAAEERRVLHELQMKYTKWTEARDDQACPRRWVPRIFDLGGRS